ncbi:MAG: sigma-54-dependent Fis family transcriptional regulator, partial [Myxococcota bacterium]
TQEDNLTIHSGRNVERESLTGEQLSRSIAARAIETNAPITSVDASGDERFREALSVHELKLRSVLCLPLRTNRGPLGALYLDNRYRAHAFSDADVSLLSAFGDQAAIALANARLVSELDGKARELERTRAEVDELNQRLERELDARHEELRHARRSTQDTELSSGRHGMIGRTEVMQRIYRIIDRVADKDVTVTILGESGTGKELVARGIHEASAERSGPFVPVNCGAIPEQLLESELFGHEQGSFTGAVRSKPGLFQVAQDGTLFLDEIGDMPMSMQVKLLRVLQQREYRRVGGTEPFATNARVISATHRDLEARVREGLFREDLWYRLNVVEVRVPALRDRRADLAELISHFLRAYGFDQNRVEKEARAALLDYDWPGNIRELENEIQRAIALATDRVSIDDLSEKFRRQTRGTRSGSSGNADLKSMVDAFERERIAEALEAHGGKVAPTARTLGLTRAGLYKKLHKYGLHVDKR